MVLAHNILIFFESTIFIYASYLIGEHIIRLLSSRFERAQHVAFAVLLGYGVWGMTGLVLGLAGIFDAVILRALLISVFILSFGQILRQIEVFSLRHTLSRISLFFKTHTFFKVLAVVWIILTLLIVFMPITGFDTLRYHLPIIEDIIATGSITFTEEIYNYTYLPVFAEIIYAVPLAIFNNTSDPYIFQVIQYSAFVSFLLIVYLFVKSRVRHSFLAIIAVLAVLSIMDLQREVLHGGYVDVLLFTTALASMLILLQDIMRGKIESGNMLVSSLLLGFAVAMKYLVLFFIPFNMALLFYFYIRKKNFKKMLLTPVFYIIPTSLIAGFWYVKNVVVYSNPIYPLITGTEFAEGEWFVSDITIPKMFLFPFIKWGEVFVDRSGESSSMLVIFALFAVLYTLILFFIVARRRFTIPEITLFLSTHLYLWIMYFNSHQERYLLASTMLLPILVILLYDRFLSFFESRERIYKYLVRATMVLSIVTVIITSLGSIHFFKYKYFYLIGESTREEYILNIGGL